MAVKDILVSGARVFTAPLGTSLPATTVAVGGAWTSWTEIGYTSGGLSVDMKVDTIEIDIQQVKGAVDERITKQHMEFDVVLAELTMANLALVWGGSVSTTAPATGQPGYDDLHWGGNDGLLLKTFAFEGIHVLDDGTDEPLRLQVYRSRFNFGAKLDFDKTKQTNVPLKIKAFLDLTKSAGQQFGTAYKVTAPGT